VHYQSKLLLKLLFFVTIRYGRLTVQLLKSPQGVSNCNDLRDRVWRDPSFGEEYDTICRSAGIQRKFKRRCEANLAHEIKITKELTNFTMMYKNAFKCTTSAFPQKVQNAIRFSVPQSVASLGAEMYFLWRNLERTLDKRTWERWEWRGDDIIFQRR